ncbi:MAG: UPF0280 family protein [Thermodesulfobacterium sp.]|nr:UPF0280 family protein [Thermodesulfobacterium sp.]
MNRYSAIPFYRTISSTPLKAFRVVYKETDLFVLAEKDLTSETLSLVRDIRVPLEIYILKNPQFLKSLKPLPEDSRASDIVKAMLRAASIAGVGPMAGVAGAIAEKVGKALLEKRLTSQVAVENGGDIFLALKKDAKVALFAGDSPFSGKIALVIKSKFMPCGVCTSSAKIGHSLSLGTADTVTVVHRDTATADALATSFGNMLNTPDDFKKVATKAEKVKDLLGVVAVIKDKVFVFGKALKIEPI